MIPAMLTGKQSVTEPGKTERTKQVGPPNGDRKCGTGGERFDGRMFGRIGWPEVEEDAPRSLPAAGEPAVG
jgi:hypothetical protein